MRLPSGSVIHAKRPVCLFFDFFACDARTAEVFDHSRVIDRPMAAHGTLTSEPETSQGAGVLAALALGGLPTGRLVWRAGQLARHRTR